MSTTGNVGNPDAIEFLTAQHRQVETLWSHVEQARASGTSSRDDAAQEIVRLLSQHDAIETQLLYPELRDKAGDRGRELSEQSLDDHHKVRALLSEVDGNDVGDGDVYAALSNCMAEVSGHVREEEGMVFPLLRQHCDEERLSELGERMASMRDKVPTHPHKSMPDSKAGAAVAGTVAGVVDKARDAMKSDD